MKHVESKLFNQNGHFYYIYIFACTTIYNNGINNGTKKECLC